MKSITIRIGFSAFGGYYIGTAVNVILKHTGSGNLIIAGLFIATGLFLIYRARYW